MKKMYSSVRVRARARVNSLPRNKRTVGKIERNRKGRETKRKIRIKSGGKGELVDRGALPLFLPTRRGGLTSGVAERGPRND